MPLPADDEALLAHALRDAALGRLDEGLPLRHLLFAHGRAADGRVIRVRKEGVAAQQDRLSARDKLNVQAQLAIFETPDRMIDRYPSGQTYTRDEVRAWVVSTWPDLIAYRNPKTGKEYAKPKAGLGNWWKRARRAEVDAAVRAAVARTAAAKLAEPIPEIDEAEFEQFVREMRRVGF